MSNIIFYTPSALFVGLCRKRRVDGINFYTCIISIENDNAVMRRIRLTDGGHCVIGTTDHPWTLDSVCSIFNHNGNVIIPKSEFDRVWTVHNV